MNAVEFLKAVWPTDGLFCIARGPFPRKDGRGQYFKHDGFDTSEEAAAFATKSSLADNVYFACHTLKGYVSQKRPDGSTYEQARRTASNMAQARCYYSDIDCGPHKPYANKEAGRRALMAFLEATGLPMPMVVSSGNGLHCYWLLVDPIDSDLWIRHAEILKALALYHGFEIDAACTADTARILRVVGTFNRKDPTNPIKVKVLAEQPIRFENDAFHALLDKAAEVLPSEETMQAGRVSEANRPDPMDVAKVCPSFVKMVRDAPTARGLVWLNTNMLSLHTSGGPKMAHALASKHPDYDHAETQGKLDRLIERKIGPPTCAKLQELYGEDSPCPTCAYYGSPKSSPVVFARRLPTTDLPGDVPMPQLPFMRTKRGVEYLPPGDTGEAVKPAQVISPYDLFPSMIVDDTETETKGILWHAQIPRRGEVTFKLPSDIFHDEARLLSALAHRGVVIDKRNAKLLGNYMSHYIRLLQQHQADHTQHESCGWTLDHKHFVWGDQVFTAEGSKKAVLSPNLANVSAAQHTKGTLEGQIQALKFYGSPAYVRQQFLICAGLGAPLLYMTNHMGVIANLSGPSGASKSTALEAAAGLWGRGLKYIMDGGEDGATALGRAGRLRMMANLPVCVDEITLMPAEQIKRMAMNITQTGDRVVKKRDGTEKPIPDTAKSTVMLCTSNSSTHALMSFNNQAGNAGSYRIFEILCPRLTEHTKTEADAAIREFRAHYGHIGPIFIQHVLKNMETVQARVTKVLAEVDRRCRITQEERFWAALIAVALVALEIARKLGLLSYDQDAIWTWLIEDQLPATRRVVRDSYTDPVSTLQSYIDSIAANMLVVSQSQVSPGNPKMVWNTDRKPVGALKARLEVGHDTLYLAAQPFRDYCDHRRLVYDTIVQDLLHHKVVSRDKIKLTRYIAEFESGLAWTLRVDLAHELMAGLAPIEIDHKVVHLFPGKKLP